MSLQDERAAFDRLAASHLDELLRAARRELRYRGALGQFGPDDLSPEELVGETLVRAWDDRHRRPALLGTRAWLLALRDALPQARTRVARGESAARAALRRRRVVLGVVPAR